MTSPRTPRQWPPGSPEPMDVAAVRSDQNDVVFRARDSKMWGRDWLATPESTGDGLYYRWFQMNGENASEGPMTLSEVLPETPEPPRPECECFTTPEEQWTRHYDATEPGSMVEPNPDCPVHFPASQSVPAVPVSSTGGKETGEAAETATEALRLPAEVQHRIDEIATGVKAMAKVVHTLAVVVAKSNRPDMAGWLAEVAIAINAGRDWPVLAPLPDSETEWGYRLPWGEVTS